MVGHIDIGNMKITRRLLTVFCTVAFITLPCIVCGCAKPEQKEDPVQPVDPEEPVKPEDPEFEEEEDDKSPDVVRTFDYASLKALGHPRVLMTDKEFADLKTKVTSGRFQNKTLYKMHKLVIDLADEYIASNEIIEYKLDGKRLLDQSQKALKRLFACAYAYRMTGSAKYLQRATVDLKTVCSFNDWHTSHFLDTGELALGVAIAYDWLYYDLSYVDRIRARRSLTNFAMVPSLTAGFHTNYGNWNQVCNAGVIAAAIACYEKDKSNSVNVIEKGIETNRTTIGKVYSPDGNYSEGYDYWGYGTGFQVILLRLLEAAFGSSAGLDETEGFMKTSGYMLFMSGPNGKDFPYADGGVGSERPKLAMWWFAAKQNDPSLLLNEMRLYEAGLYPSATEARLLPMIPCMIKDVNLDNFSGAVPSSNIWYGRGETPIAMVHTGWKFDEGDRYLGIKGGKANSGHGHMDAGSFVYDAFGVRWSDDYTRPSYGGIETALSNAGGNFWSSTQTSLRWDVCKMNNLFHSTISFNNPDGSVKKTHPTDFIVAGSATLEQYYDTPDNLGARINMTAAVKDQVISAVRTITLVNGNDLKIVDVIKAKDDRDAKMMWRMMTSATATNESSDIKLVNSGKTMYLKTSYSGSVSEFTYQIWPNSRPADWNSRSWDTGLSLTPVGYSVTIPKGTTVTFTTILSVNK